jgi:PEP-CTERM motif
MKTPAILGILLWGALVLGAGAGTTFGITYTTLDDPLAIPGYTEASGISGGNIVGAYTDNSFVTHGFLYNGSTYTTLDGPLGTGDTAALGISGSNIVGYYRGNDNKIHGFLYNGSTYTTLDAPLADFQTYASGISGGKIVGWCVDSAEVDHGFLYDGSTYTTLDGPLGTGGAAIGISGGNIVGYYGDSIGLHGFLYDGSTYTTLDDPLAVGVPPNNAGATLALGISGGNIVGHYDYSSDPILTSSFLYNGSTYAKLDDPLATDGTYAQGIDGNTIVGVYFDNLGDGIHGFVTTVPEPSSVVLAAFGFLGLAVYGWRHRPL